MNQEYFSIELSSGIILGVPLANMGSVAQFEVANICTVPGVARFWYGVANFKGSLLWILDSDRFFNLNIQRNRFDQKLTAVILKNRQSDGQKKVALVTQKLKGIVSIKDSALSLLDDEISPQLRSCCSAMAHTETQTIFIVDSLALLQQLHQKSTLALT